MITAGMCAIILLSEYTGCVGKVTKVEWIPQPVEQTITVIRNVRCPNGKEYDYIVGIQTKDLAKADCRNRP